jgi:hypothetical protein
MLKFIELCHILDGQKNLQNEVQERKVQKRFSLFSLLGFVPKSGNVPLLSAGERADIKQQTELATAIFGIFRNGVEIMDEVDLILHPLKSELNWPLGQKEPLDFTRSRAGNGLRWNLPGHLLDAILSCSGMPILAEMADSREASKLRHQHVSYSLVVMFVMAPAVIIEELKTVIAEGLATLSLQSTPHLALISKNFYG